ncbi:MAG: peroxiredoxin family protein [Phycisphaerales bacterium]
MIRTTVLSLVVGASLLGCASTAPEQASVNVMPEFSATTIGGDTVSTAAFEGRVAILDFWAVW